MKRSKLEIIQDILKIIQQNHNEIKPTPLLRKSNLSSSRFQEYFQDLLKKEFIIEKETKAGKIISLTEKGFRYLEKYKSIIGFIEEFDL
ncbi:winged helix-turn-helix transcriptional regulator [archaeon]|jgi:predicted transcriptional regulator|nr:winged helix-turn-helix transcriptional regulator [archaeon]